MFFVSQLLDDPLRRRLLDRAAEVGAGRGMTPQDDPRVEEAGRKMSETATMTTSAESRHTDVAYHSLTMGMGRKTRVSRMPGGGARQSLAQIPESSANVPGVSENWEAAPDIPTYKRAEAARKMRLKHIWKIYVIEALLRIERPEFYSSLSPEARGYLQGLQENVARLPLENKPESESHRVLVSQVAQVFSELGVHCELDRRAGPFLLHIVAAAITNPSTGEIEERVYECDASDVHYAPSSGEEEEEAVLTAATLLRHRLLGKLGVRLVHISDSRWESLDEAQRLASLAKLHDAPAASTE